MFIYFFFFIYKSIINLCFNLFTDNEVFEFKCSQGLLFDVTRQICDYKVNVDNCDVTLGTFLIKFQYVLFPTYVVIYLKQRYLVNTYFFSAPYLIDTLSFIVIDD